MTEEREYSKEFIEHQIAPAAETYGKLGRKVFGVRLPLDVEQYLLNLEREKRVLLMRKTLVREVRKQIKKELA